MLVSSLYMLKRYDANQRASIFSSVAGQGHENYEISYLFRLIKRGPGLMVWTKWVIAVDEPIPKGVGRGMMYSFYLKITAFFNMAVTESDRDPPPPQGPINAHNLVMTVRKMS